MTDEEEITAAAKEHVLFQGGTFVRLADGTWLFYGGIAIAGLPKKERL